MCLTHRNRRSKDSVNNIVAERAVKLQLHEANQLTGPCSSRTKFQISPKKFI